MAAYLTPTEMATESLIEFVRQAWEVVEPAIEFKNNWHVEGICKHLEAVVRGDVMNIIFNIPPGCMKSLLCCVFWPAWVWTSDPSARFLFASYGEQLSIRDSRRCRDLVESPWYRARWGEKVQIVDDQNQKIRFDTTERGWRMATSVGGRGTGEHPDYIVADDPQNAQEASSETERLRVKDWWDGTISSRGVIRGSRRIIVMQRLHEDDLSGHVLAKGGFDHYCLPMRFEPDRRAVTSLGVCDPRTEEGELLWPEAFPEEKVAELERNLTPLRALGQLQQRPTSGDGSLFKVAKLEIVSVAPADVTRSWRAWDFAATDGDGDYTAGVKMSQGKDGLFYIEDVVRGQWSTNERRSIVKLTAGSDGRKVKIRGPQDPGSAGVDAAGDFTRMLAGYSVKTERVTGSKESRAEPFAAQVEAGNVRLVEGAWNRDFIEELRAFPLGRHDDQCLIAGTLVVTARGEVPIEYVTTEDFVMTRKGFRRVVCSGQTGVSKSLVRLVAIDGREITGTPNHPIWIHGIGFISLGETCLLLKQRSTTDSRSGGIPKRNSDRTGFISSDEHQRELSTCIATSGQRSMDLFQTAARYTTLMGIRSTIQSTTLNVAPTGSTCRSTHVAGTSQSHRKLSTLNELGESLPLGIDRKRGELGIESTQRRLPPTLFQRKSSAKNAGASSLRKTASQSFAETHVERERAGEIGHLQTLMLCVSSAGKRSRENAEQGRQSTVLIPVLLVEDFVTKKPVFNLSIEEVPEYFANGMLVHNCDAAADAFNELTSKRTFAVA